jgi:glutamine amidotransferase
MCRALLYLGSRTSLDDLLFKPDNSLIKQVHSPRMLDMQNLAGFGLRAWDYTSDVPELPFSYSTESLPVFDQNLKNLAEKVKLDCLLAHVRGVPFSGGRNVSRNNNHPFSFPGYKIVLAHNGDLAEFGRMKSFLVPHISPQILEFIAGVTDSEWIYALLLSQLDDPTGFIQVDEMKAAIEAVFRIIRDVRMQCGIEVCSSVNLFITDGHQVIAVRHCFNFGHFPMVEPDSVHEHHLSYLSLWYTLGTEYGYHDDEWKTIGGSDCVDTVIVASEPLTRDTTTWLEVPEYSMLSASTKNDRSTVSLEYLDL